MANIRIDLQDLVDGMEVVFQAPADCSEVTGLIAYYPSPDDSSKIYKEFSFTDAHGNDLANIDNLFVTGAYVKIILDIVNNRAFVQNGDTNGYLENHIQDKDNPHGMTLQKLGSRPNANLLHNWYFANPVNRNGKTEYDTGSASGYTIDRWWMLFAKYDVETQTLTQSTSTQYGGTMRQPVDYPERFAGKTVTLSILAESVTGACTFMLYKATGINSNMVHIASATITNGLTARTGFTIPSDVGGDYPLLIATIGVPIGGSVKLKAIKLELGDTQTLAHQDSDGNWVLNEIPDYAEQMAICMQYDKSSGAYLGLTPQAVGAFATNSIGNGFTGDCNDLTDGSWAVTGSATNTPDGQPCMIYHKSYDGNFAVQMSFNFATWTIKFRYKIAGTWRDWESKFLPLDGSVPMTGALKCNSTNMFLDGKRGKWLNEADRLQLETWSVADDNTNRRMLQIYNPTGKSDSTQAFKLNETVNGVGKSYNIFGEHNMCPDGAGAHNATYRGKYLGDAVTDEQYARIADGTFRDLYIGDYWTIGSINYRIAAFDYYYNTGDTACTTHHVTLVPDTNMYTHVMNDTNITTGAYVGSKMYASGLTQAKTTINNAFGSAHILNHRQLLPNTVTNGYESGHSWYDSTVELMTEHNVYGGKVFKNALQGTNFAYNHTVDKSQYPLFTFRPDMISNRQWFWLRDVASSALFACVSGGGHANGNNASYAAGVRPAFSIIS